MHFAKARFNQFTNCGEVQLLLIFGVYIEIEQPGYIGPNSVVTYPSLSAAQAACSDPASCSAVLDKNCGLTHGEYFLCSNLATSNTTDAGGNCVYIKKSSLYSNWVLKSSSTQYPLYGMALCSTDVGGSYTKVGNTFCNITGAIWYSTLKRAEAACDASLNCKSVYVQRCSGNVYQLCENDSSHLSSSSGSCIYEKPQ